MTEPPSDNNKTQPPWGDGRTRLPWGDEKTQPPWGDGRTQSPKGGGSVQVGDLLYHGRYKVLDIRGGGMGVVYKCEDTVTNLTVALKTVQTEGGMTQADVEGMKHAFRLLYRLEHKHIIRVRYFDHDDERGNWFVVMDWVDGEDLETRLRKSPTQILPAEETVRILGQVASALDYAHDYEEDGVKKGVVHRDVKCANIMLNSDGDALLIDFGIAGRAPSEATTNAAGTATGGMTVTVNPFTGTLGYQPPEQWDGQKATPASDEYSLAVTAYRCLSGHLPFEHPNRAELREMVKSDPPPRIRAISDAANAVLRKAMAKDAGERYGSCAEFIRELAKGLAVQTALLPLDSTPPPLPQPQAGERLDEDVTLEFKSVKLKLKHVAAGTFLMGSPEHEIGRESDEKQHHVTLTKDFWLGETAVTQAQYEAVTGKNPSEFKKGGDYPVEHVSWGEAMAFCKAVTERERAAGRLPTGYEYTLPTEAQWEYAARGGGESQGFKYSGSDNLDEVGWYNDNSVNRAEAKKGYFSRFFRADEKSTHPMEERSTHPVGRKKANELGLYDMSGNVWEWCSDSCEWTSGVVTTDTYQDGIVDPLCRSGRQCVIRGGSWCDEADNCRSADRISDEPNLDYSSLGFRIALVPAQ